MVELWSLVSIYTFLFFGEVLIKINGLSLSFNARHYDSQMLCRHFSHSLWLCLPAHKVVMTPSCTRVSTELYQCFKEQSCAVLFVVGLVTSYNQCRKSINR